jgi:NAD(P)-dependent dehydrogenase (short-subunit alcohol dehydrogenase family)
MSTISLVTGSNRGIGREVCRQLAELGHTVILTAATPAPPRKPRERSLGDFDGDLDVHGFAPSRSG